MEILPWPSEEWCSTRYGQPFEHSLGSSDAVQGTNREQSQNEHSNTHTRARGEKLVSIIEPRYWKCSTNRLFRPAERMANELWLCLIDLKFIYVYDHCNFFSLDAYSLNGLPFCSVFSRLGCVGCALQCLHVLAVVFFPVVFAHFLCSTLLCCRPKCSTTRAYNSSGPFVVRRDHRFPRHLPFSCLSCRDSRYRVFSPIFFRRCPVRLYA